MNLSKTEIERLENAKVTYEVILAGKDWIETTNTTDEAIQLVRDLVEADHEHILLSISSWHHLSHGKDASIIKVIRWLNIKTGKHLSKTIKVKGVKLGDIGDLHIQKKMLWDKWDEITALFR